ncbi:hypothetical protein FRC03_005169 [Tulasnella sp. 419]|nr:hypothetical protein FRC03_005169 [Tulasnella sp. 419]
MRSHRDTLHSPELPSIHLDADYQEQDRKRLEALICSGIDDMSFVPSASERNEDDYSVEYPRHGGNHSPVPFDPYSSYGRSQDHFDRSQFVDPLPDEDSHSLFVPQKHYALQRYEESIEGGETVSTAAHHRSGLTLGAGLGFRSPISGAGEYDPDRELQQLINNRGHMSMFDDTMRSVKTDKRATPTSRRTTNKRRDQSQTTFDPVIVDDTTEIDRAVENGHLRLDNIPPIPTHSYGRLPRNHPRDDDETSIPDSESSHFRRSPPPTPKAHTQKPKLSAALDRVADERRGAFSPRRQGFNSPVNSPRTRPTKVPTNQPHSQPNTSNSTQGQTTGSSRFGSRARGLAQEIDEERKDAERIDATIRAQRNPLIDIANQTQENFTPAARRHGQRHTRMAPPPSSKVVLPDVTGLTSAIETPVKVRDSYMAPNVQPAEVVFLTAALEDVTAKYQQAHRDHSVAVRRLHELELEFHKAQEDAAAESRRMQELMSQKAKSSAKDVKGKGREDDAQVIEANYRRLIQEKKVLEGLVTSLRAQIVDLKIELENREQIIEDLRQSKETDAREIAKKKDEVEKLLYDIDYLKTEVSRLRGVVEAGLEERRTGREVQDSRRPLSTVPEASIEESGSGYRPTSTMGHYKQPAQSHNPQEDTFLTDSEEEEQSYRPYRQTRAPMVHMDATLEYTMGDHDDTRDSVAVPQPAPTGTRLRSGSNASTLPVQSGFASRPGFLPPRAESPFKRPQSQLSSKSGSTNHDDGASAASSSRSARARRNRFIDEDELAKLEADVSERRSERANRSHDSIRSRLAAQDEHDRSMSRASDPGVPSAPKASAEHQPLTRHHSSPPALRIQNYPPFPRIRGERMERLFFAPSRHDENKCPNCRAQKQGQEHADEGRKSPEWLTAFMRRRNHDGADVAGERLPNKTIVSRVIGELEEEFNHYKAIYIELAQQYAIMDPASNVAKRNVLAEHLKEVIDVMEHKGDQVASLYETLSFDDKVEGRRSPPVNH